MIVQLAKSSDVESVSFFEQTLDFRIVEGSSRHYYSVVMSFRLQRLDGGGRRRNEPFAIGGGGEKIGGWGRRLKRFVSS